MTRSLSKKGKSSQAPCHVYELQNLQLGQVGEGRSYRSRARITDIAALDAAP
jgi:hypothetical protein